MPINQDNILQVYGRLRDVTEEQLSGLLQELAKRQRTFERRIAAFMRSVTIPEDGLDPAFAASQIQRFLDAAGLTDLDIVSGVRSLEDVLREYAARNPFAVRELSPQIAAELREIRDVNVIRVRGYMRRNADRLRNLSKAEWVDFLQDKGGNVAHHAETLVRTELHGALTDSTVQAADEASVEYFRYDGVISANSRTFCRRHKGNVYHIDVIEQMDNNMLNPVITYRGGYNCVHRWTPVPNYQG